MIREISITTPSGYSRVLISETAVPLREICSTDTPLIITDTAIAQIYRTNLSGKDFITVPTGEACKSLEVVQSLYQEFCSRSLERRSLVVGFGGGALLDLVGFAASTYNRGIRCGYLPTSLLAQVDASVGGKNGVNFAGHKNLIGTIRQPEFVFCDTSLLGTLPISELRSGYAEVIKHAVITPGPLFNLLQENADKSSLADSTTLSELVFESIRVKARIVQSDETEQGERKKLNFGHSIGHALEAAYQMPHGYAVAIGMVVAAKLSISRGYLSQSSFEALRKLIRDYGLPTDYELVPEVLMSHLLRDKKRQGDTIQMILLEEIGRARIEPIALSEIRELLQNLKAI
jgi:3-dehydroquinate synthase